MPPDASGKMLNVTEGAIRNARLTQIKVLQGRMRCHRTLAGGVQSVAAKQRNR